MIATQLLIGAVFAALIACAALRAHALSRSGALAAFVVGTLTFGLGGWPLTVVLLAFFIPSVALSRIGRARKKQLTDVGKTGPRDGWQVLANGGIATVCAVLALAIGSPSTAWLSAFAGAYAAATADTWGTEIGTLFRRRPVSILTLRPIATGLSGGITLPGSLAEIAGAIWIAGIALAALGAVPGVGPMIHARAVHIAIAIATGGIIGALVDSVFGATVQELRHCPTCGRTCETNPHDCGTPTDRVRGLRGFGNDAVNFAATASGAIVGYLIASSP